MSDEPKRKCHKCAYFRIGYESWELPQYRWGECRLRPPNENLRSFPFKNGCRDFSPSREAVRLDPQVNNDGAPK